ncbi:MAG: zf-HC2 domain-containing protein [Calditrichia bacterium]|nr:zf-HC2 domain-containing protein [Calditrichia bacterium]
MKCEEIQKNLNDYLDNELPDSLQKNVKNHLNDCSDCQKKFTELQNIVENISRLPKEISPDENLWPEISKKINPSVFTNKDNKVIAFFTRYKTFLSAAAIVLFFIGALFITIKDNELQVNNATEQMKPHMQSAIKLIKTEYTQTRQMVETALNSSQGQLSAETIKTIEFNLKIIDEASKNILQTLEKHGAEPELLDLYYESYLNQVKLLQQTLKILNKQERKQI